ncbi:MAG: hypothetical protein MJK11_12585 [Pseudomonadales bacterium]|nr:hypothetical protein [Pseudomonadales bacterium]
MNKVDVDCVVDSLNLQEIQSLDLENIDEDQFKAKLRKWRNMNQMFIIFMDSNQLWSLQQVLETTTKMVDVAIQLAFQYSHQIIQKKYGKPTSPSKKIKNVMSVLAMGKLGACELNLSSDIDLILSF